MLRLLALVCVLFGVVFICGYLLICALIDLNFAIAVLLLLLEGIVLFIVVPLVIYSLFVGCLCVCLSVYFHLGGGRPAGIILYVVRFVNINVYAARYVARAIANIFRNWSWCMER